MHNLHNVAFGFPYLGRLGTYRAYIGFWLPVQQEERERTGDDGKEEAR